MTDVILVFVMIAFFVAAAVLVRLLSRMIDASGYDVEDEEADADPGDIDYGDGGGPGDGGSTLNAPRRKPGLGGPR
jgi:hypothetical protein